MTIETSIQRLIDYWTSHPIFDPKTQAEIRQLVQEQNTSELTDRFYRNL